MFAFLLEPPLAKYTPVFILGPLMQYLPTAAIPLIDFSIYTDLWQSVTGIPVSNSEFIKAGERIHILERLMNTREGIKRHDDVLPGRLMKQGRKSDTLNKKVELDKMISQYYTLRGYDIDGIPLKKTIEDLELC